MAWFLFPTTILASYYKMAEGIVFRGKNGTYGEINPFSKPFILCNLIDFKE
jgi:hypothetical protein